MDKPVITIPEKNLDRFEYFITKYNWKEIKIIKDFLLMKYNLIDEGWNKEDMEKDKNKVINLEDKIGLQSEIEVKEPINEADVDNKEDNECATADVSDIGIKESTNQTKEFYDVYSQTMAEMRDLTAMTQMKDMLKNTLDSLNIKQEAVDRLYNAFKLMKDADSEKMTDQQIDNLFNLLTKEELSEIQSEDKTEEEFKEFKRALIELIISTAEGYESFGSMDEEMNRISNEFKVEMDKLLSSLNMTDQLENLTKAINEEKDEEKKKELYDIYTGLYASMSLENILDAIENKGYKILVKESKKKYDKVYKDAYKILEKDLFNNFTSIKGLLSVMNGIFPNNEDAIRVLVYTIFRQVIKNAEVKIIPQKSSVTNKEDETGIATERVIKTNKSVSKQTATFLNYFILNIVKLTKKSFKKEDSKLYNSIISYLEAHKN